MSELHAFGRYLVVAAVIGTVTVGLREGLGAMLSSLPGHYAWSMILAYGVGVLLSYWAQGRLTFGALGHRPSGQGLRAFLVVALLSALLTALLAYALRYGLLIERALPSLAAPLAFASAALMVAPVSFLLGRGLVFGLAAAQPAWSQPRWAWPTVLVLVGAHAIIFSAVHLRLNTGGAYDDALFLRLAQHVTQGAWLGPYTATTLVKGPGFPLWLAGVHGLKLPVTIAASLTYAAACGTTFVALRPWIASAPQRVLIFAALLACPAALSDFAVMRELIYPALTLLVTACGLGLAARIDRADTSIGCWCWASALGLCSALFVLTREEWIWLSPIGIALVLWGFEQYRRGAVAWRPLCGVYGFTCLFALLPLLVVASLNRHHYGVFTVSEFTSRPFVSAYGALTRVHHSAAPRQVPVPRETWSRIAAVSPAFSQVHEHLQGPLGDIWLGPSAKLLGQLMDADPSVRNWLSRRLQVDVPAGNTGGAAFLQDRARHDELFRRQLELFFGGADNAQAFLSGAMERESGGGWFVWMLREAVVASGQHVSATSANRFYQRLADEVNAACDKGRLQCKPRRDTLRPPLQWRDWAPFSSSFVYAMEQLVSMPGHATDGVLPYLGGSAALADAESFLHDRLALSRSSPMPVPAIEWLTVAYRYALPWIALVAVLAWLRASRWPGRRWGEPQRQLWLVGGLLLVLVLGRLGLLALIHVTAWPAANDLRYLSAAQPLLVLFSALGLLLIWPRGRDQRTASAIDAARSD